MPTDSAAELLQTLRGHDLLGADRLAEAARLQRQYPSAKELAGELLRRGWLTAFQVNRLLRGGVRELLLGQYVLLDRLGEGGMGQVYRARHRRLDRVDALKVIRPDRLIHPDAVRRFQREARAAARLAHPNLVTVYDAGEADGVQFIALEYVAGTDLHRLAEGAGPLPIATACEYVRQAAAALQHAHERGLVHRDVKPSNLLVAGSVVKLLDLGLARLGVIDDDSRATAGLTETGAVMGTPDFMAPEQADDFRKADIRADVYSLGCTLYFLLTGHVPYPGGTTMEKLLRHRLEEPLPLQTRRPEVPAAVLAVLRKMMAKRPADRFATPGAAAAALTPFARLDPLPVVAAVPARAAEASTQGGDSVATRSVGPPSATRTAVPVRRRAARWLLLFLPVAVGLCLLPAAVMLFRSVVGSLAPPDLFPAVRAAAPAPFLPHQPWKAGRQLTAQHSGGAWVSAPGVAFSPDGAKLAAAFGTPAQQADIPIAGCVRLWEVDTGKDVPLPEDQPEPVVCVAFSPDGTTLAWGQGHWDRDVRGTVVLWDVERRQERRHFDAHPTGVRALEFHPGGKVLYTGGQDGALRAWNAATGVPLWSIAAHTGHLNDLCLSPDAALVATAGSDGTVGLWDARTGAARGRCKVPSDICFVSRVAFAEEGRLVIGATGACLNPARWLRWGVDDQQHRGLRWHGDRHVVGLRVAADGRTVATIADENPVRLWDAQTGEELQPFSAGAAIRLGGYQSVAFAPDGKTLAQGGGNNTGQGIVQLWHRSGGN